MNFKLVRLSNLFPMQKRHYDTVEFRCNGSELPAKKASNTTVSDISMNASQAFSIWISEYEADKRKWVWVREVWVRG
jgi:hypothetical protein